MMINKRFKKYREEYSPSIHLINYEINDLKTSIYIN